MGLELSEENVTKLVEGHNLEISTEDLVGLQQEEQHGSQHGTLEEQEEEPRQLPLAVLRMAWELWGDLQTLENEHHEHQAEA
ncbi:hypothetical protein JRQ81_002280 [Phrynocephalus forsythii]|uniref:Uncharacterized protein n=1 Tax=Phrynocephalus forsythii TaxID=171643 RepID=A0A9Q0XJU2_9SAUR|nr:hypothetical protein JRQ81_002280 [Phrynocephalus forsythii]